MKERKKALDDNKRNSLLEQVNSSSKDNSSNNLAKVVVKQSNKSKETTMNILNIVGKVKHILSMSIKNPFVFVDNQKEKQTKLHSLKEELNKLINKDQVVMNQPPKMMIDKLELSQENTVKNEFDKNLKLDLILFEMDDVYKNVKELKDLNPHIENKVNELDNNILTENSLKRKVVYKRLFDICADCMTDIQSVITKENKKKRERKKLKKETGKSIRLDKNEADIQKNTENKDSNTEFESVVHLDNLSSKPRLDKDNSKDPCTNIKIIKPNSIKKDISINAMYKKSSIHIENELNLKKKPSESSDNTVKSFRSKNKDSDISKRDKLNKEKKTTFQISHDTCYSITHNSVCLEEKLKKVNSSLTTSMMNFDIITSEKPKHEVLQNTQSNELSIIQSVSHKYKKDSKLLTIEEDPIIINSSNRSMVSNFSKRSSLNSNSKTAKTSLIKKPLKKNNTIFSASKKRTSIKDNPFIKSLKIYKPGSCLIDENSRKNRMTQQYSFGKNSYIEEANPEQIYSQKKDEIHINSSGYKKSFKSVVFNTDMKKKKIDHVVSLRHSNHIAENQLLSISKNTTIDTHKEPNMLYLSSKFSLGVTPQQENSPIKEIDSNCNVILEKASYNSSYINKEDALNSENQYSSQMRPVKGKKKTISKEEIKSEDKNEVISEFNDSIEKISFNRLENINNKEENKLNISHSSTSTKNNDIKSRLMSFKSFNLKRNVNASGNNKADVSIESKINTVRSNIDDDIANVTARSRYIHEKINLPLSKIDKVKKPGEDINLIDDNKTVQNDFYVSENSERNNQRIIRNEQLKMLFVDCVSELNLKRFNSVKYRLL
jgi:hypothetical protein